MNKELEAIKDAWDKNTGDGRDEKARDLAKKYVQAHPELYGGLGAYIENLPKAQRIPTLVELVSKNRDAGDLEAAWNTEAWMLAYIPPQNIGGEYIAEIELPNK